MPDMWAHCHSRMSGTRIRMMDMWAHCHSRMSGTRMSGTRIRSAVLMVAPLLGGVGEEGVGVA